MSPPIRHRSLDTKQHRLAQVAHLGHQNTGRGAVVLFSDVQRNCTSDRWLGTEYPYFVEDCLLRRLIQDVWLRNCPVRCRTILSDLVQKISSYDPASGMIVVVLSASGEICIRHVCFERANSLASSAA